MRLTNNGLYFLPQFFNLYFWFCCCYLTGELIILVITNLWDQVCGFLYNACIYTTYVCLIIPHFRLLLRFFVLPKWCYRTGWVPKKRLGLCHLGHLGLRKTIVVLVSMLTNRYISIIQQYKFIIYGLELVFQWKFQFQNVKEN